MAKLIQAEFIKWRTETVTPKDGYGSYPWKKHSALFGNILMQIQEISKQNEDELETDLKCGGRSMHGKPIIGIVVCSKNKSFISAYKDVETAKKMTIRKAVKHSKKI